MTKQDLLDTIKKAMEENPRITDVIISEEHISYNYHPPFPLEYIRLETLTDMHAIHPVVAELINWKATPEWYLEQGNMHQANCPVCGHYLTFKYRGNDLRNGLWRLRCISEDCGVLLSVEQLHGQLDTICMDLPIGMWEGSMRRNYTMTVEIDYQMKTIEAADWYGNEVQKMEKHVKFPLTQIDYNNIPGLIKEIKEHLK